MQDLQSASLLLLITGEDIAVHNTFLLHGRFQMVLCWAIIVIPMVTGEQEWVEMSLALSISAIQFIFFS